MERKIGERFIYDGGTLEVAMLKNGLCKGCYLCDTKICGYEIIINYLGYCAYSEREDKKDVIFKKVE